MTDQANVSLKNGNTAEGVVILNLTLDELNNSDNLHAHLTQNNFSLEANSADDSDESLAKDEDLLKLQKLLEDWNLLQLLPILKGKIIFLINNNRY